MRVFGYVRRSSSERKTNYSVESQKKVISEIAARHGEIVKDEDFYIDEGYSGSTLKRPNVQKLLRKISLCNEAEIHLYIWLSSRLSRNLMYTNSLRHVFDKYNVKVISANDDWVSLDEMVNTPDSSLRPNIIGAADEAEIARDRYRTKVGLKTSAERGNYAKGGVVPPTGYKFVNAEGKKGRTIEIDEEYVMVMLYILKEIHDHKRTIDSIALELDNKKVCGLKWSYSKVYKAVTNKIIYGCFESSYVMLENHSPAYITKEYYNECMNILHGRRKEVNHKYLFKKKIQCCNCNVLCSEIPTVHYPRHVNTHKPKRENKKTIYKYYCCPICKKRINEDKMLRMMISDINRIIINDETTADSIKRLEDKKLRVRKKLDFLDEEYEEYVIDDNYYLEQRKIYLKKHDSLKKQLESMEKQYYKNFNELPYQEKKKLISKNYSSIEVDLNTKEVVNINIKHAEL